MSVTIVEVERRSAGSRVRTAFAVIVLVIAMLLTPVALVGNWAHRTVTDSEQYLATVGPLIEQPQVQQAISEAATNAIVAKVDTTSLVSGLLDNLIKNPQLNQALSAPISSGINSLIGTGVSAVVASDAFKDAWYTLNDAVQRSLMLILEGKDGDVVTLQGDQVVLDMTPLLQGVQQALVAKGFTIADKIQIPAQTATFVLFESPGLAQLRMLYSFTAPIFEFLPLLLAALFALAVWLSRRRGRMTMAVGICFGAMVTITAAGLAYGQSIFDDKLAGTILAPISAVVWSTLFNYLDQGIKAMLLLAAVLIIIGLLASRIGWATRVRMWLKTGPEYAGSRIGLGRVGDAIANQATALRIAVVAACALILTLGNVLSMWHVIWTVLLGAGLITAIQVCVGSAEDVVIEVVEVDVVS